MLGWFKKKFKKQEPVAPTEEVVVDDLGTDTLPPEQEHPEDAVAPEAGRPLPLAEEEEQGAGEPIPSEVPDQVAQEETVPEVEEEPPVPEKEPVPVQEKEVVPDLALEATPAAIADEAEKPIKIIKKSEQEYHSQTQKKSLFSRLTEKLGKTRETFTYQLDALFLGKKEIDADMLDDLEEILITADLGVGTTLELLESARRKVKRKELYDPKSLKEALKVQIKNLITANDQDATLVMPKKGPFVIMVIGVNGVGKTTTIGKIAQKFKQAGSSVMLVAGDTFRAAAVSQLKIWGERSNVPVVAHQEGADPSSVVFDALGIAQAKNIDVVLVDTAGRMHTKENLMEELKKIKRVMGKKLKGAPHEIMLVIDATTGQNGISQARLFDDAVGVTGITLTKLDGTSKGGIVANICKEMKIPIRFIGIGEKMNDLRDFDAVEFVDALFHSSNNRSE
jgi:fused signal recognition particle receptor